MARNGVVVGSEQFNGSDIRTGGKFRAAKVARMRRYYAQPNKGVSFAALAVSLHNARDRPGEEQVTFLFVQRRMALPWPRPDGKHA